MPRITLRKLRAIQAALSALEAGLGPGEGDWPEDVSQKDVHDAQAWARYEWERRGYGEQEEVHPKRPR